ncbi:MAG: flagellar protein [Lachnospiraceae bacterium]
MDVRNCKECGKLFDYVQGDQICVTCKMKCEKKFNSVRDFIRAHEKAILDEIAETNEVSVRQIRIWIREERLTFSKDSPIGIECENCGTFIRTGRFCNKCKNNISHNLKGMLNEKDSKNDFKLRTSERMRFLDK